MIATRLSIMRTFLYEYNFSVVDVSSTFALGFTRAKSSAMFGSETVGRFFFMLMGSKCKRAFFVRQGELVNRALKLCASWFLLFF